MKTLRSYLGPVALALAGALYVLALAGAPRAHAEAPIRQTPIGFCSLSSLSAATSVSTCSNWAAAQNANYAVICAYTAGVVYRDDGVAPTATPGVGGQGISSGTCTSYSATISALQFIQQGAGAILGISFYK